MLEGTSNGGSAYSCIRSCGMHRPSLTPKLEPRQTRCPFMWQCPKCGRRFRSPDQTHYCGKVETIDQYIAEQSPKVQPILQKIREVLRDAAPNAKEKIAYQMPTFWQGKNLIYFAAFKKHISIFPGGEATAFFAEKLTEHMTSKGTIRLPLDRPIPYELIAEIARWRVASVNEGSK